jgi:hypothetical protein
MRELDGRHRALAFHESSDPLQRRNVRVVPDAGVAVGDAAALLHRGRLHEHDAGAALRELAEVHEVPVGDMAVLRRVLAHRRHDDAVPRRHAPQAKRLE